MLRRTHPQPAESIEMLREKSLRKYTEVYTEDNELVGSAIRLWYRPIEDVNPELLLYRTYLMVQSVMLGGPTYIPTVFIGDYDPAANRMALTVDLKTVMDRLWNREPNFVARGLGVPEELPLP